MMQNFRQEEQAQNTDLIKIAIKLLLGSPSVTHTGGNHLLEVTNAYRRTGLEKVTSYQGRDMGIEEI